jgi:hypothetical protein
MFYTSCDVEILPDGIAQGIDECNIESFEQNGTLHILHIKVFGQSSNQ